MARSARATRYRAPAGFVPATSRVMGIEVYQQAGHELLPRCGGCGARRTSVPCVRCGAEQALVVEARGPALDRDAALEAVGRWLARSPCPPAALAEPALERLEVPCDQTGAIRGVLPAGVLSLEGELVPGPEQIQLERSGPLERVVVVPVWRIVGTDTVVHGVTGEVLGPLPLDHDALRRRALIGLVVTGLIAVCVGTPLLPFLGAGLVVWAVGLAAIAVQHRRWRRAQTP